MLMLQQDQPEKGEQKDPFARVAAPADLKAPRTPVALLAATSETHRIIRVLRSLRQDMHNHWACSATIKKDASNRSLRLVSVSFPEPNLRVDGQW